jgi:hypothetical protein
LRTATESESSDERLREEQKNMSEDRSERQRVRTGANPAMSACAKSRRT